MDEKYSIKPPDAETAAWLKARRDKQAAERHKAALRARLAKEARQHATQIRDGADLSREVIARLLEACADEIQAPAEGAR